MKCIVSPYFGFMLSNLYHAKLCLFVFSATSAASNWQFISICSCVFEDFKHPWLVRETQICQVADSNPIPSRVFAYSRLIST